MYNGKIEVVSFVIKCGRKLILVKNLGKYQEMNQWKLFLLFLFISNYLWYINGIQFGKFGLASIIVCL
jgi:hypothetical protein